jgi:acyl carrier protein
MEPMTDPTVLAEVIDIVRRSGRVKPGVAVAADSLLVEDLAIDSLDLVDVLLKIQDHFDVDIDDADVPHLRRVSDLAAYIVAHRGSAAA